MGSVLWVVVVVVVYLRPNLLTLLNNSLVEWTEKCTDKVGTCRTHMEEGGRGGGGVVRGAASRVT